MKAQYIIDEVSELLKPLGFNRQRATWNRRSGGTIVEVLNVQTDKSFGGVTVNVGLTDIVVGGLVWSKPPSKFVAEPTCFVRARLGALVDGRDKWWELADPAAPAAMVAAIREVGLPFLERYASRNGMRQWLLDANVAGKRYPPPILGLAVIESQLGDHEQACTRLADLRTKSTGAWGIRVVEVAARLGCITK